MQHVYACDVDVRRPAGRPRPRLGAERRAGRVPYDAVMTHTVPLQRVKYALEGCNTCIRCSEQTWANSMTTKGGVGHHAIPARASASAPRGPTGGQVANTHTANHR